jgi:hypothetical protein
MKQRFTYMTQCEERSVRFGALRFLRWSGLPKDVALLCSTMQSRLDELNLNAVRRLLQRLYERGERGK